MQAVKLAVWVLAATVGFVGCAGADPVEPEPTPAPQPEVRTVVRSEPVDYDRIAAQMERHIDRVLGGDSGERSAPSADAAPVAPTPDPVTPTPAGTAVLDSDVLDKLRGVVSRMGDGFYRADIDAIAAEFAELRRIVSELQGVQ